MREVGRNESNRYLDMSKEFNQDIADAVCELIMDGASLRKIEAIAGMPKRLTILKWLRENQTFQTQYAHAREEQAEALAEEILDISDEAPIERVVGDQVVKYDATAVARNRLRVDSRKWVASKLKPKKYGDRVDVTTAGESLNDPATSEARLAHLLGKAGINTAAGTEGTEEVAQQAPSV